MTTEKIDSMTSYMRDIGQIPLINIAEECQLAAKIKNGDDEAWGQLVQSNLRLVVKIAHDFKGPGLSLQDLISEGNVGLMRAAQKFDPAKGAKFSSYAAWWIKQAMRRALLEKSKCIRIPVTSAGKINKIRRARAELRDQLDRDPTNFEISQKVDFSERVVARLSHVELKSVSLQDPISANETGWLHDLIPDENAPIPDKVLCEQQTADRLNRLLQRLDKRERSILFLRYGLDGRPPKTLGEVSKVIGRTRERVRQIQKRALAKLRSQMRREDEIHAEPQPQFLMN
ncbi:MAG: RNA polymerase primary sigma factor [Rhodothermales bacterium]|jgi:RNA polymerase primary sigma factor